MAFVPRRENLALAFQELLTLGERLRSGRQVVTNAQAFKGQIWEAVKLADRDGRAYGYEATDVELATFAVIAFLDESILNLRLPVFADWPRQPLQEERYGHHKAGEIFFQNLEKIMGRTDAPALADLLEVYDLCLLLGFSGRYSLGNTGELRSIKQRLAEKLYRIRQPGGELSPQAALPPGSAARQGGDKVATGLMIGAIASVVLTIALYILYNMFLNSGARSLSEFASRG